MSKMRQNSEKQLPMSTGRPYLELSQELQVISDIPDSHPRIYDKASEDITQGKSCCSSSPKNH